MFAPAGCTPAFELEVTVRLCTPTIAAKYIATLREPVKTIDLLSGATLMP